MSEVVAGVYLERNGGAVMRAIVRSNRSSTYNSVEATHVEEFSWNPDDDEAAVELQLIEMAEMAADMADNNLRHVGIASYGPFVSLKRPRYDRGNPEGRRQWETFGKLYRTPSHRPLTNTHIPDLFQKGFDKKNNGDAFITVRTDAEACAIGEAVIRDHTRSQLMAFILVTEGIGLGIVQGKVPITSALHSEFGLLHVRQSSRDPLPQQSSAMKRPPPADRFDLEEYHWSLSELADNQAIRKRYCIIHGNDEISDDTIIEQPQDITWSLRAYYIAQACLACNVTLAPHKIIIGADLDTSPGIVEMTRNKFDNLLKARFLDGQPVFHFDELRKPDYLDTMQRIRIGGKLFPPSFRRTGAFGMCYAAANPEIGQISGFRRQ